MNFPFNKRRFIKRNKGVLIKGFYREYPFIWTEMNMNVYYRWDAIIGTAVLSWLNINELFNYVWDAIYWNGPSL